MSETCKTSEEHGVYYCIISSLPHLKLLQARVSHKKFPSPHVRQLRKCLEKRQQRYSHGPGLRSAIDPVNLNYLLYLGEPFLPNIISVIAVNMKFSLALFFAAVAVADSPAKRAGTISVTGSPPGFAYGVTGGGNAAPVYPTDVKNLIELLGSDDPQVIVIDKTFNFIGTEGTTKGTICKSYGAFEDGCQSTIDIGNGCDGKPSEQYEWDTAGTQGIRVHSDKTIIGVGNKGVLLGKGLRIVEASNIIIQNIMITNLNPQLVWGGDAITLSNTSNVWVDHVTVSQALRDTGFTEC